MGSIILLQLSADALPYYTMSSLSPTADQTYQCQVHRDQYWFLFCFMLSFSVSTLLVGLFSLIIPCCY